MRKIIFIIGMLICVFYWGCQDVTVGYLLTEDASYSPDSLVVKATNSLDSAYGVLNPAVEEKVISMGLTLDKLYSSGMTFEQIAAAVQLEPYIGRGEDYIRVKWGQSWVSTPIEGVDGTLPIYVSINDIESEDGDISKLKTVLTVRGDGTFEMPLYHDTPVGRYIISLTFENEGYSKNLHNCFTIIVR